MAEKLIDVADASTTYNARKSSNQDRSNDAKKCEVSKTSFFCFDKNYRPREYDKTNKVLPPSQTDNRTPKGSEIQFLCEFCSKKYKLHSGLKRHQKNCTKQTREVDINPSETTSINISQQHLTSRFEWENYKERGFVKMLNTVYDKVVFWRKNNSLLPSGRSEKLYIEETTRLVNSWTHNSPLQDVAFKVIMVMPNLLLQKPSRNSESKDHLEALERRLHLWKEGELTELLIEGETIQRSLSDSKKTPTIAEER